MEQARTGALDDIGTGKQESLSAVSEAQKAAVDAVGDQKAAALDSIKSASSGALTDISNKKADGIAAVEAAGQKTLDSIPEDYTRMDKRITALEAGGFSVVDGALCITYEDGVSAADIPESEE